MMVANYDEFEVELAVVLKTAEQALRSILLSRDRTSKHAPYSWQKEPVDEHILKAIGHIAHGANQWKGYKPGDGEDHLHNAITRLLYAKWLIDFQK